MADLPFCIPTYIRGDKDKLFIHCPPLKSASSCNGGTADKVQG